MVLPPKDIPEHHLASGPHLPDYHVTRGGLAKEESDYLFRFIQEHSREKAHHLWPGPGV